jgi:ABC-2 type transport system ATP-binding protein
LKSTGGRVEVMRRDVYEELSASENLSYWAEAYGVVGRDRKARVSQLLEVIGLIDRANEPVR